MQRRDFLNIAAAGVAAASFNLPGIGRASKSEIYKLRAGEANATLIGDGTSSENCWLYNASCPGPLLRRRKGEMLNVAVTNDLSIPTTVHWHGIRNVNEMDGVANLTQPPIEPGEQFLYEVPLTESGTYWYHAHTMGWEQVARGLYGPLIIDDDDDPTVDHDYTLMIDDWRLTQDGQIDDASFGSLHDWSHAGRFGNWLTVNGTSDPVLYAKTGARLRLRLINAANARIFKIKIGGAVATLIAEDGAVCLPEQIEVVELAPGQRADLIIDMVLDSIILTEVSTGEPYPAGRVIADPKLGQAEISKTAINLTTPPSIVDLSTAKVIAVHMQGGAMGNLTEAIFNGDRLPLGTLAREHKKLWAFNEIVGDYTQTLADIQLGQVVALDVFNDTAWPHAMHLHGHHFWVLVDDPKIDAPSGKRDTWLMPARSRARLVFVADNPGLWLFHCHMLEHAASGMGMVLSVG